MATPGPLGFIPILPKPATLPRDAACSCLGLPHNLGCWLSGAGSPVRVAAGADGHVPDLSRYVDTRTAAQALADAERYEALKALLDLADDLLWSIEDQAAYDAALATIARARRAFGMS